MKEAVLLMRYRSTDAADRNHRYMSYRHIAQFLKLTIYQVQHICCYKPVARNADYDLKKKAEVLEDEHVNYIKADSTLLKMAGRTLKERSVLFEVEFPGKKLTARNLRSVYKKHKIKKKKVQ